MAETIWEILVPKNWPTQAKEVIDTHHHWEWDQYVKDLAGGSTILRSAVGYWTPDQKRKILPVRERMIPVRIVCDEETIRKIAKFTLEHYKQEEVLVYKISDEVIRVRNENREGLQNPG